MVNTPQLLGNQINFQAEWNGGAGEITIFNHEIGTYRKAPYIPAVPTYETGPLGQISQRQINMATVPYQFDFEFFLDEDKRNDLEGLVSGQHLRYFNNNNRANVNITLNDERMATLELLTAARQVSRGLVENRFDDNPTSNSIWQYSQFTVKCTQFLHFRFNSDTWRVSCSFVESQINLSDLTV